MSIYLYMCESRNCKKLFWYTVRKYGKYAKYCCKDCWPEPEEVPLNPVKKKRKNYSKRIENKEWQLVKSVAWKRDKGLCVECGEKIHHVHHIIPVDIDPSLQHEVDNLVCLCYSCHRTKHPELPAKLFEKTFL